MTRANSEVLTPDRVRSAVFSPTRLGRRGIDEGEVRAFCEWVSDGLGRLLNDNAGLQEEVMRLRNRLISGKEKAGPQPEDAQVQAVYVLSRAQQTADRYVADAQEYSRELAQDAQLRRDEVLREAKMRASMILEEAHTAGRLAATQAASQAASQVAGALSDSREPLPAAERQELQAEITYLRTFSDVCRTHLRAYMESLSRSIEQWEQVERKGAAAAAEAKASVLRSPERV
jgi:cell division septum initiation protein DivIVA